MYLRTVVFICECTIRLFTGNSVASSITRLSERRDSKTYFSTFHLCGTECRKCFLEFGSSPKRDQIGAVPSVNMLRFSLFEK